MDKKQMKKNIYLYYDKFGGVCFTNNDNIIYSIISILHV